MSRDTIVFVDGCAMPLYRLVDFAKQLGYHRADGWYLTSECAVWLQEHGHTVEERVNDLGGKRDD